MQLRNKKHRSPPLRSSLLTFSFTLAFLLSPLAAFADLDKEEVKKKEGEEARPALDSEEHAREHQDLIKKGEEMLKEINRLLDEIQSDLSQKSTGSGTQGKQEAAIKRMDELIQELGKGCKSCGAGSGSSSGKSQSPKNESQKEGESEKQKDGEKEQKLAGKKDKMKAEQPKPESEQEPKGAGKVENNRTDKGKLPDNRVATLSDRLRELGRWGVLPPKLTEEMLSTGGKEAPAEYREIISRYYKRMNDSYERGRGR